VVGVPIGIVDGGADLDEFLGAVGIAGEEIDFEAAVPFGLLPDEVALASKFRPGAVA
jgi:hypothetical protein